MNYATHRRIKTGNLYRFLFVANKGCKKTGWCEEAIYMDMSGGLWARPLAIFNLRFEELD